MTGIDWMGPFDQELAAHGIDFQTSADEEFGSLGSRCF